MAACESAIVLQIPVCTPVHAVLIEASGERLGLVLPPYDLLD